MARLIVSLEEFVESDFYILNLCMPMADSPNGVPARETVPLAMNGVLLQYDVKLKPMSIDGHVHAVDPTLPGNSDSPDTIIAIAMKEYLRSDPKFQEQAVLLVVGESMSIGRYIQPVMLRYYEIRRSVVAQQLRKYSITDKTLGTQVLDATKWISLQ